MSKKMYAVIESDISLSSILESEALNENNDKAFFRAVIQTADELNAHRRIYPKDLLLKGITELRPKIQSRTLLGEMDHPLPTAADPKTNMIRESVVMYKEASHLFTNIWMEGNKVIADVETLSTQNGKDLARMALIDKLPIGFSLRAFGNLRRNSNNTFIVTDPFVIVTWDAVSNPSHKAARLYEIKEDDVKEMLYSTALMEGIATSVIDSLLETFIESNFIHDDTIIHLIQKHIDILKSL